MVYVLHSPIDQKYQGAGYAVVSIMYRNGPDIDKDKEWDVDSL